MTTCANPRCQETRFDEHGRCVKCHTLFVETLVRGRYVVERMVGKGGFGITYLVKDTDCFGEPRILKELSPVGMNDELEEDQTSKQTAERLFNREAKMLLRLQHPGIPKLYAYFAVGTYSYLVQDWIPGVTLAEEMRTRQQFFEEPHVCRLMYELAEILEYLHGHNPPIIHRDIKPQNLMLHPSGKLLLIDFGAVHQAATVTRPATQTLIGSPGYAPPEQIYGTPVPQSDLYAVGATILYLLSGVHPTKLFNHFTKRMEWENRVKVGWELAEILTALLTPEVKNRLQTATALKQQLARLISTNTASTRHSQPLSIPIISTPPLLEPTIPPTDALPLISPAVIIETPPDSPPLLVPPVLPMAPAPSDNSPTLVMTPPALDRTPLNSRAFAISQPAVDTPLQLIAPAGNNDLPVYQTVENPPEETGYLGDVPFPFLLRRIYQDKLTGKLTCKLTGMSKTVYFEDGSVVYAKSTLKDDRLGEYLISISRITPEQFEQATQMMKSRGMLFGSALIKMGILATEELKPMIVGQFSRIVYSLFEWTNGYFEITREQPRKRSIKISLSTADIIFEGLRQLQSMEQIKHWIGDFRTKLAVTNDPFLLYQAINLNPREAFIVSRIENSMSIDEILSLGGLPEDETLKTLCGLLSVGLLERVKQDTTVAIKAPQPIASVINQQPIDDLQSAANFCYEVENMLANLENLNYYGLLGISRKASDQDIHQAYADLAKKFHPDRHTQLAKYNLRLRSDLEKIFKRISDVYTILSNPLARQEYDRNFNTRDTLKLFVSQMPSVFENRNSTSAPPSPSPEARRVNPLRATGSQSIPRINTPSPSPTSTGHLAASAPAPSSTPSTSAHSMLEYSSGSLNRKSLASDFFQKGMRYYEAQEFKQAYPAFRAAIDNDPQNSAYRLFLARTLTQLPGYYAQAREEFLRAIDLAPQNPDYYAEFGLFYQKLNMFKQATRMFERALELAPNHPIARRAINNLG